MSFPFDLLSGLLRCPKKGDIVYRTIFYEERFGDRGSFPMCSPGGAGRRRRTEGELHSLKLHQNLPYTLFGTVSNPEDKNHILYVLDGFIKSVKLKNIAAL
jgi:hypothetical protein